MGLVHILLNNRIISGLDLFRFPGQVNTLTLTSIRGFHNEGTWILLLIHIIHEVFVVMRHHVGLRKEVKLLWQQTVKLVQVVTEGVLFGYVVDARVVIDSLMEMHIFDHVH